MSDTNKLDAILSLQRIIKETETENNILEELVVDNKKKICKMNCKIWDLCEHLWVRDYTCNFDDLCKNYCSTCGLWKDRTMYS